MKYSLILAALAFISLLPSCTSIHAGQNTPAVSTAGNKDALIGRISQLPSYALHEEETSSFIARLHSGCYWTEAEGKGTVEYLRIGGDGCIGSRLFMLVNQTELFVLHKEWEGDPAPTTDTLMRHNPQTQELDSLATVPKSIMAAATCELRPTRTWSKIQSCLCSK